jgi:CBS domain-containing protein
MQCKDAMKHKVLYCRERDTVARCAAIMAESSIGFLPVIDAERRVVGVLTDRDLVLRVLAKQRSSSTTAQEVMSRNVVKCTPDDSLDHAEKLLAESRKSRLVLVDAQGMLAGVISLADIAQLEDAARAGELLKKVTRREATGVVACG